MDREQASTSLRCASTRQAGLENGGTSNIEHPTPNIECQKRTAAFAVQPHPLPLLFAFVVFSAVKNP
jgi:hypothetical protein